jgi:archaellum component FlaC
MKHIKLFEQFLLESDLDKFYNSKIKNPKSGREVTVKTILGDPDNPLYKKVKAKEDQLKGGSDDNSEEIKKLEDEIKEMDDRIEMIRMDIAEIEDEDPDDYRIQELEEEEGGLLADIEMAKEKLAKLKK